MSDRVILKTPRLRFVMWDEGDAALVQQLHSTMTTTRYLPGSAPWSLEKAAERLRGWFEEQARDGTTKYKIVTEDGRSAAAPAFHGSGASSSNSATP